MTEKYKNQIDEKLIDQLISQIDPKDLIKKDGIFSVMKKKLVERALEAEMNHELGYSKHDRGDKESYNRRNGNYEKTIIDNEGSKIRINVPRDREGEYEPQLVPKGLRRFEGFDDQVISLYARGMTMGEIQGHIKDLYKTEVSKELISTITDEVIDEVNKWQNRC